MDYGSGEPHQAVVKILLDENIEAASKAFDRAAENGCIEVLKMLLSDQRVEISTSTVELAARKRHKEIVKLLLSDDRIHPENSSALRAAVANRHAEVARLLIEDGRCPTEDVAETAARVGNLELFLLLFPQESTNVGKCLTAAVHGGKKEILKIILSDQRAGTCVFPHPCH